MSYDSRFPESHGSQITRAEIHVSRWPRDTFRGPRVKGCGLNNRTLTERPFVDYLLKVFVWKK